MPTIPLGSTGESRTTVSHKLTAPVLGSGSLPVFATPAMIALMEAAAVNALAPFLELTETSVGTHIDIRHLAATGEGKNVRARAEVAQINGRVVTFTVQAWDEQRLIGEGQHSRYIVDITRFMQRIT